MKRGLLLIVTLLIVFLSTGCTHYEYLLKNGEEAFYNGELPKAKEYFEDLEQFSPDSYKSYFYLGFIDLYQDRPLEAIAHFEKSLTYNQEPDLEYLGLGQAYVALEDYEMARDYLEKAKQLENYPVVDYLLGFIYLQSGDKDAARNTLNSVTNVYPERGEIWAVLGKLFYENLQILDAAQAYQMAFIHGIRTYDLYTGLAEAYFQLGNFRQAIAVAEQALTEKHISVEEKEQIRLKLAQYNINQNPSKAIESLESILVTNPNKAEVQLMLGQLYFQQENYQKSLAIFNQYLKHSPPLAQVLYLMYRAYLIIDDAEFAEKSLLAAIEIKPKKLSYYLDLINLYHAENRLKDVIPIYNKAIDLSPKDSGLVENLVSIYLELGEHENALTALRKAIELTPKAENLYLLKAFAHNQLKQVEAEQSTYEALLKFAPNNIIALNNLAQLLRDTNHLDEAYTLYKKASEVEPTDGRYERNLGYISLIKGQYAAATEYLKTAVVKNSEDYEAYRFLGDSYFACDQYSEAITAYVASLEIKDDYYFAMYPLGKAYFYNNDLDKAKVYFEAYLKRYPQNDSSKFYLTRIEWLKDQKTPDIKLLPAKEDASNQ